MTYTAQEQQASQELESKLLEKYKPFTLNDAVAVTGLHVGSVRRALEILISKYHCALKVTENGDLIYDFGKSLRRRGERTWAEFFQGFLNTLWKIFMIVFKIWIAITLVTYFVVFIVILIVIIVVMLSKASKDDDDSLGNVVGAFFNALGEIFKHILTWNTHTDNYYYVTDNQGYTYRQYEPTPSPLAVIDKEKKEEKSFVAAVYDFVFGPERAEIHPLANQQEVASYIRKNKGLITTAEIIGLAGWKGEEAEDFLADCVARFNGEPKISENKVLYVDFYELSRSQNTTQDVPVIWYWDEYEPEYHLNGNDAWTNGGIIFMGVFNLIFGLVFMTMTMEPVDEVLQGFTSQQIYYISLFLGTIPTLFSTIFFTVPILRYFYIQPARYRRVQNNIRKRVMKAIFQHYNEPITLEKLERWINAGKEASLSTATIKSHMKQLVQDLWGDMEVDSQTGSISYVFNRLRDELNEIERLKSLRKDDIDLGNVVIDID
ncbi:MAG: hypothetical protein NZ551_08790 [Microscillaceae bacterium]|nr:hypothetical protein [Microscillaceae bacterium]MDW8461296.1 hypothetical protein [Cytophagales bacterium]